MWLTGGGMWTAPTAEYRYASTPELSASNACRTQLSEMSVSYEPLKMNTGDSTMA